MGLDRGILLVERPVWDQILEDVEFHKRELLRDRGTSSELTENRTILTTAR